MKNKSNFIPQGKQVVKESLWTRIKQAYQFSFYIGKLKIQGDTQGGLIWKFGITIYPQYKQFEINVGRFLINFWYRS